MTKEQQQARHCRCGYDKDHYMVSAEGEYSVGGWIAHTVGISTIPRRIKYRCRVCRQVIEETTDPALLRGNIGG